MKIDVLSLFPEMFEGVFHSSILKKAQEKDAVQFNVINFRDFSLNKHHSVDDYPYGGGAGMVLTPQPVFDAVSHVREGSNAQPRVILLCPQGEVFHQRKAEELVKEKHLVFICGHYEGYDERIRTELVTDEISIGDYVLTGGELGAMVIIDSVVRLLDDVLGNQSSAKEDSHSTGRLEHPHYTRPADFRGLKVPDVLLSGNHKEIDTWRRKQSFLRTLVRRPDMLDFEQLTDEERAWLDAFRSQE